MAHAKDKGSSKNVKKKAQKSVKEKRAEKKAKKGAVHPLRRRVSRSARQHDPGERDRDVRAEALRHVEVVPVDDATDGSPRRLAAPRVLGEHRGDPRDDRHVGVRLARLCPPRR